jgi:hypothetical protein
MKMKLILILLCVSIGCSSQWGLVQLQSGALFQDDGTVTDKSRLVANVDVYADNDFGVGYHGFSDITAVGGDGTWHFGRHGLTAGMKDASALGVVVLKTNEVGLLDTKLGIRLPKFFEFIGGRGFLDITFDDGAGNLNWVLSRKLTEWLGLWGVWAVELPYKDGSPCHHYELGIFTPFETWGALLRLEGNSPGSSGILLGATARF